MIIIKVQGGLGNQLMQYSFGRSLQLSYGKDVAYDLSFFDTSTKYTQRPYLLDMFNLEVRCATVDEIQHAKYPYGIISKGVNFLGKFLNKYFFKKYYIGYDKHLISMLEKKNSYYLEGFWQSYKYYEDNLQELSKEITLKDVSTLVKFKDDISFEGKVSVSVHIRRGDFTKQNAGTKTLGKEYYESAVPLLEKFVENPAYFIFSDDIGWVKDELGHLFKNATYVSSYGIKDYEEFALMKECKHAILSNSTFAWFSTLLTNTNDKFVIHPNDWKNPYLNGDNNICPPSWKGI